MAWLRRRPHRLTLMERFLPTYDIRLVQQTVVRATPADVDDAVQRLDALLGRDPLVQALAAARLVPLRLARLLGRPGPVGSAAPAAAPPPFVPLARRPGAEVVFGLIGQFWTKGFGYQRVTPRAFASFDRPGYAKVALAVAVRPQDAARSRLTVETRIAATDAAARVRFRRYWRVIGPGAQLVMWRLLALLRAGAEDTARRRAAARPASGGALTAGPSDAPRPRGSRRLVGSRPAGAGALAGLVACALLGRYVAFTRRIRRDVAALLAAARPGRPGVVTAEMLAELPAPVRRVLTYAGVVGQPFVHTVYLRQTGQMHLRADGPWIDLAAEQWYTVNPPGFVWSARLPLGPLPLALARDQYAQGDGHMLVRAGGVYPLADATGPEMDQGALLRYLQEMAYWFPAALLGDNVTCEPIDDGSARLTLTDWGRIVSGVLHVDADGRITDFVAQRYRTVAGGYRLDTWSCPVSAYGELAGLRLPVRGQGVWRLPEGDLAYIDVTVTALDYTHETPAPGPA